MSNSILRIHGVRTRTGLSTSTIYKKISEGNFPKPISLGERAVGWIEKEINVWLQQRIDTSRNLDPGNNADKA